MIHLRDAIVILSSLSAIPALIIGWKGRHLFWWYCLISFMADAINNRFDIFDVSNGGVINIFLLFEWLLIGTYLTGALFTHPHNIKKRQALVIVVATAFIAWTLYNGSDQASYSGAVVLYCIYIVLLLACLYKIMRDFEYLQLEKSPFFVFCAVFLIFTSGSITLLGLKNYLSVHNPALGSNIWVIHNLLNLLKNGVLAYCIYLLQKSKK